MSTATDQRLVREVIASNRYLTLSTAADDEPWAAPIEYLNDDDLNLYFLSTGSSRHSRHIEENTLVAVAIFDAEQPGEYSPDASMTLRGVQIRGTAERLSPEEYPDPVKAAIEVLHPPMPPYHAYRIVPSAFYLPKLVDGVNERVEVDLGGVSARASDDAVG